MATHWSDWLFWIGGWTLAGGGALLLLWALIGNRSRGRRRCRKCWYDMGSIDAVDGVWTCPECGKRATQEKHLLRTRRRWRWAVLAMLMLLGAYPVGLIPAVREKGWSKALPSSVLVFITPIESQDFRLKTSPWMSYYELQPQTTLLKELLRRSEDRELAPWQYQILLDRLIGTEPLFLRTLLWARNTWPEAEPLLIDPIVLHPVVILRGDWLMRVRARGRSKWVASSLSPGWERYRMENGRYQSLGTFKDGTVELECEVLDGVNFTQSSSDASGPDLTDARVIWRGSLGEIAIGGVPADHIERYDSPAARNAVANLVLGVTTNAEQLPQLVLRATNSHIGEGDVDWGLGFHAEVFVDDRLVARGSGLYNMTPLRTSFNHGPSRFVFDLDWTGEPETIGGRTTTVRLSCDPRMAIRDFSRDIFWGGEITIPAGPPDEEARVRLFFLEREKGMQNEPPNEEARVKLFFLERDERQEPPDK